MRSPFADILNSNPKRSAHPIQGAAFLSYFVDENVPWAHLDIAGVASPDAHPVTGSGPNGFGVRLLHDLAKGMTTS
jgi:leucyl aminopeptidase